MMTVNYFRSEVQFISLDSLHSFCIVVCFFVNCNQQVLIPQIRHSKNIPNKVILRDTISILHRSIPEMENMKNYTGDIFVW